MSFSGLKDREDDYFDAAPSTFKDLKAAGKAGTDTAGRGAEARRGARDLFKFHESHGTHGTRGTRVTHGLHVARVARVVQRWAVDVARTHPQATCAPTSAARAFSLASHAICSASAFTPIVASMMQRSASGTTRAAPRTRRSAIWRRREARARTVARATALVLASATATTAALQGQQTHTTHARHATRETHGTHGTHGTRGTRGSRGARVCSPSSAATFSSRGKTFQKVLPLTSNREHSSASVTHTHDTHARHATHGTHGTHGTRGTHESRGVCGACVVVSLRLHTECTLLDSLARRCARTSTT